MGSGRGMPDHVSFEILLWLPVVSLLRFKAVCKSWFANIESTSFITQHLQLHSGKGSLLAFYHHQKYEPGLGFHFRMLSGYKYEVHTHLGFEEQRHAAIDSKFDMVDSCNGVVCLHDVLRGNIVLWNPALKQLRVVSKSSRDYVIDNRSCVGFGHDAKTNDYKVVRIIWCWNKPDKNRVAVYSLRSSSWKVIHKNDALPFTFIYRYSWVHATSRDGVCFWTGSDNKDINLLVSFGLKDEVFETISLPNNQHNGVPYGMDFLNDKLVYVQGVDMGSNYFYEYCEIWMLHEFGVKESWNKTHKIGPFSEDRVIRMFGFSKDGDILILPMHIQYQLHLYNLDTKEMYPSNLEEDDALFIDALHYNESLVSLKIS